MSPRILRKIIKDLKSNFNFSEIKELDNFSMHFGICMYLRNKYLWQNSKRTKKLLKYFKCNDVDTLSHSIVEKIKKKI